MNVKTIGIDLAKKVFQVHGIDEHSKAVVQQTLCRSQMTSFFANIPGQDRTLSELNHGSGEQKLSHK